MADQNYPLLFFPAVAPIDRDHQRGGGEPPHYPTAARQGARIGPKLKALQAAFDAKRLQLQQVAPGHDPEMVVVFETVGTVRDFTKAVSRIRGLEWLLESEEEEIAPDEDFYVDGKPTKSLSGRLFLIGSNQAALTEILSLWERYQNNAAAAFPKGLAPWKHVFEQLKEVRYWSVRDRIGADVALYWQNRIDAGIDPIRFEIEIWHFASPEKNDRARDEVAALVAALNGRVLSRTLISEIAYHGMLVEMPTASVAQLLTNAPPELVMSDRIMFFRPKGQAVAPKIEENLHLVEQPPSDAAIAGAPVVALLDGLPIQNHPLLAGRLIVDDPDGWAATYSAQDRVHGTAMASLIALGDLDANEQPLSRPIYVRPVLRPDPNLEHPPRDEITPDDVLLIDLMHRAVRRICEGDANQQPAAPTVRIINLSLGDIERPFDRALSPWARLVDWLAFRYRVLFIISAGNHAGTVTLPIPRESIVRLTDAERHATALQSLLQQSTDRPILAPAESINGLTIGAQHADATSIPAVPHRYDLFESQGLSPYSRIGYGFRRAIKPDLLFPGGRMLYQEQLAGPADSSTFTPVWRSAVVPGHRVATLPNGALNTRYTRGTSAATALGSRGAAKAFDVIETLRADDATRIPNRFDAVLLKALLAHGAGWGDRCDRLALARPDIVEREEQRKLAARWLGYGTVDLNRALTCTEQRATLIGIGELTDGKAYEFSAPLPPSLAAKVLLRRCTVTLAWLSPINPAHQAYRRAKLWISPPTDALRVKRKEAEWRQAQRGTLQHEILEGDQALAFVDGDQFACKVNCAADAGELAESIPFALCVSLEVAEGVDVPVYQEIRDRIRPRVEVGNR